MADSYLKYDKKTQTILQPLSELVINNGTDLDHFSEVDLNLGFSDGGAGAWANLVFQLCRIGGKVCLSTQASVTAAVTAANAPIVSAVGAIPAAYRPAVTYTDNWRVANNAVVATGLITISNAGTITFNATNATVPGTFTGGGVNATIHTGSVNYNTV